MQFVWHWNVAGAFLNPNGITVTENNSAGVIKDAISLACGVKVDGNIEQQRSVINEHSPSFLDYSRREGLCYSICPNIKIKIIQRHLRQPCSKPLDFSKTSPTTPNWI